MTLGIVLTLENWNGWRTISMSIGLVVACILIFGFFGSSIWNPINTERVKNYVEGFDNAQFSSASWQRWAVPTVWLQESGVPLDLSKPRTLLQAEIAGEQNAFILGIASRTGMIVPADLSRVRDPFNRRKQLLDPHYRNLAINSIQQSEFEIGELVMLDQWNDGDIDLLESRLLATIQFSLSPETFGFADALIATKILAAIGRPCTDRSIQQLVQQTLVAMQRTRFNLGGRKGGFATYPTLDHSDLLTTSSAVELMKYYGVPSELDLMAIRSFLRPSMNDGWMVQEAVVREATKMRLESHPQVPALRWWDYVRYEPSIAMAIVFTLLCFFATLGCPNRSTRNA